MEVTLVSGNKNKMKEYLALLPKDKNILITTKSIDLPEIQSMDLLEIIEDKARRAYEIIKSPVIVEDVAAGLDSLNGLPGPFIKFFIESLENNPLLELSKQPNERATITCTTALFDGKKLTHGVGTIKGIVVQPRGKDGFGFDFVFVPDGYDMTMSEMGFEKKNKISHRSLAIKDLFSKI